MRNRFFRIGIYVLFLFCFAEASGQTARIIDSYNNDPISNVAVFNTSKSISTLSSEKGEFDLSVFSKNDTIHFQHPTYEPASFTLQQLKTMKNTVRMNMATYILPPIVAAASRSEEKSTEVPFKIEVISRKEIELNNPQTTADVLENTGSIQIQKSQMGGGSPVIRGFEANKVLIVVDGVRMNNAIYRSGHIQNVITIDNSILDKAEVIFGPSSVIYGSDALGGVMHFYTKDPVLSSNDSVSSLHMNAYKRYSSANNENTTHLDFSIGLKKWGFLTSFTNSQFDDLRAGKNRLHGYDDFGKTFHSVKTIDGIDSMVANPDPDVQLNTGYSQSDILQKIMFQPNDSTDLTLNIQSSTSSNIPRYSTLNDYKNGKLRFSEWYYGPQNRFFSSLRYRRKSNSFLFHSMSATLAYQRIDEDRITRGFGDSWRNIQEEDVKVYSLNFDFVKNIDKKQRINYGFELTHNDVKSQAIDEHISTLETISNPLTRYPDGGSELQTFSFYLTDKYKINEKVSLLAGARNSISRLVATFVDSSLITLPFDRISLINNQLTGSVSLVYNPNVNWKVNIIAATGYRAPNVDDVGKVREKNDQVLVPNNDLSAEHAYSGEVGITRFFNKKRFVISVNTYYTLLKNAIVRRDHQLKGRDSILYNGSLAKIQTNKNTNQALIYGANLVFKGKLTNHLIIGSSINYTYGEDITNKLPLGHIPPLFGKAYLDYGKNKVGFGSWIQFNGKKDLEDFSPSGEDNEDEATVDGSPAWYTFNVRSSYKVKDFVILQAAVHNLLDQHYKQFSSAVSGAGRNLVLTLRVKL